jgi:isopentenyl-diphosphate delta-isomerase
MKKRFCTVLLFLFSFKIVKIMLQQRAHHKYHSPLLWTNTCCSHQRAGETNIQAGSRRLYEEMGFKAELNFSFYLQSFDNGLTEHELDHVMIVTTTKTL